MQTNFEKKLIFFIFACLTATYAVWTWTDVLGALGGDNAWYLLTAKYISPYSDASLATQHFAQMSPYPPLIPLILAITGGAESLNIAHFVTTLFLIGSFVITYLWLRQLSQSRWVAAGIVIAFASTANTYLFALEILSENYFIFFSMLTILLVTLFEKKNSFNFLIMAALVAGASYLIRSAGVALIAGFIFYAYFHCNKKQLLALLATTASPSLIAFLLSFKTEESYSYNTMLMDKLNEISSFELAIEHFTSHILNFIQGWLQLFHASSFSQPVYLIIGLLGLMGMAVRISQKKIDGFYLLFYLLLLLAWPFSPEAARYLYPVQILILIHALFFLTEWKKNIPIPSFIKYSFIALLFLLNIPTLALTIERYNLSIPNDLASYKHTQAWYSSSQPVRSVQSYRAITDGMVKIRQHTPSDACVFVIKPSIAGFFADRISYQTPLEKLDKQAFFNEVKTKQCEYFYPIALSSISYRQPFYPANRIQNSSKAIYTYSIEGDERSIVGFLLKYNVNADTE
jgi:hypothetical protein